MKAIYSTLDEIKLNLFTLSFQGDIEKTYLQDHFKKNIRHIRMALLLAIFFYGIFGVLDAWLVPVVKETLWFIRYVVVIPFVSAIFLFSFTPHFIKYMHASVAAVILVAGLGIIGMIVIAPSPANYSYYAGLLLVFMFGYTFFKLRFIWATLTGWLIVIAYEIAAIWVSQTPIPVLINNNFFFLTGNVIGMFASYSIELYSRRNFIRARLLETERKKVHDANRQLERRVEERTVQLMESNLELKQEIEERKRVEEALKGSEQRFRSLSENSPDIIYTLGKDGAFTYVNPAWEKILGHEAAEVYGQYFVDFAREEDAREYVRIFKRIRDAKEMITDVVKNLIHKDGTIRRLLLSGAPNMDSEGHVIGMVGLIKDITEQEKLQDQLQQAQKMEAIGTLAGGVAHDFNNLLQAIEGYTDLLLLRKNKEDGGCKELQEIKRASQRASELTQQLLTFSRKVESKLRPIDLNREVGQVHKLLERTIPKMIDIELRLTDDLRILSADPGQIEQVLMNLGLNARDAMPEGGKLVVETKNITLNQDFHKDHFNIERGDYVLLTVSDNGHGMNKDTVQHIFEPFYTTKGTGKGTGLGLAMVYGIVKSHGGYITCRSKPGKGTTFKMYLPAVEPEMKLNEVQCEEMLKLKGGSETIMFVDDEAYLRDLGEQILNEFGYTVFTAPDGESALDIYQQKYQEIDLIILDLIMPGMGGARCLNEILGINNQAKIVIASGYSSDEEQKEFLESKVKGFIHKPYGVDKILDVVREQLDQPSTNVMHESP